MSNEQIKIEVSGERYISFSPNELHYTEEFGVMRSEPNIVMNKPDTSGQVHIVAIKDRYSLIDLRQDSDVGRSVSDWIPRSIRVKMKAYNLRVYNKNTDLLLMDSGEYVYESTQGKGTNFNLKRSKIKTISRVVKRRGGYRRSSRTVNYPNIWKDTGVICEGNASITTGENSVELGLKKMVQNFFTTKFNSDLRSTSLARDYFLENDVLEYYIERRIEQLGMDDQEAETFRNEVTQKNSEAHGDVYDFMYFFAVLGVDYSNLY